MKISLRGVIILIALSFILGSVAVVVAQRTGGYKEIAKDDAEALAAAEFAVKAEGEKQDLTYHLVSVEHAEQQVVAGINYRLCLKVGHRKEGEDEDTVESVRVVVYKNLQRAYSLTSWAQENCAEDAGQTEENRSR
jgi:ABC-type Na+ efflux pump permease subunit